MRGSEFVLLVLGGVVGFHSALLAADAPAFAGKPAVTKTEDAWTVTFSVNRPTDVAVVIEDVRGQVVRHLAAGMLGKNAPAPLMPDSLEQSLTWDGKDDDGKPASGGILRARVALGLRPTFDRLIGYNPGGLAHVRSLAVGPDGTLYVFNTYGDLHPSDGTTVVVAFDRTGKYLRQVIPYPANLPEEKLSGLRRLDVGGRKVPFLYQAETRSMVPGVGDLPMHRSVVTRDGRLVFVGHQEWVGTTLRYNQAGTKQVVVMNTDGSTPEGGVLRTVLAKGSQAGSDLALAPDDKTFYATGLGTGIGTKAKRFHAVYRFALTDAEAKPFIGNPDEASTGKDRLNLPSSVAADKDGNVYVADKGNNRIAVFSAAGAFLGEVPTEAPERVEVHPKTGAVYVLGGKFVGELTKFASYREAKPVATVSVKGYAHQNYSAVMALDASAEPAVLWIGNSSDWAGYILRRIEDRGSAFGEIVDVARSPQNTLPDAGPRTRYKMQTAGSMLGMAFDKRNQRLYLNKRVYDLKTGEWRDGLLEADGSKDGTGSFGLDGNFYSQIYARSLRRIGPDGKTIPFVQGEKGDLLAPEGGSYRLRGRGVTADRQGNVYALMEKGKALSKPGDAGDANNLFLYAPDGALKNDALIDSEIRGLNSVCLDRQGNIYLAIGVRPAGKKVPDAFAGLELGKPWSYGMNANELNWYPLLYGSIVKFGPTGGVIRAGAGGVPVELSDGPKHLKKTEIKGAQWVYFGASPVPSWRLPYPDTCLCESPRIDVDAFGRTFFPDAARFRVGILDTNGNELAFFGAYGNQDSAGPGSVIPEPAIAFYWPYMVAADDRMVYVADRFNRRVVAVRLSYAAEETVEVK